MKPEFLNEVLNSFLKCVNDTNVEEFMENIVKNIVEGKNTLRNIKILKMMMKNES